MRPPGERSRAGPEEGDEPVRAALLQEESGAPAGDALVLERELNKALLRVDESFDGFKYNTGIAALMTFVNEATKLRDALTRSQAERFVKALSVFAPHIGEELWSRLGHAESLAYAAWPEPIPEYLVEDEFELVVQVNGKLRARINAPKSADKGELEALARGAASQHLEGKEVRRAVVVPGRLVNFVVG